MKAAVVGCGRMGAFTSESIRLHAPAFWLPQSHADAISAHPALTLAALCDPDPEALRKAMAVHEHSLGFSHHKALLESLTPDLAGIATRTIGRADIMCDFIAAGTRALHVEKPLCNSVVELERLEATLLRPDIFLTYGTLRRYFSVYQHAIEIAHSGRLGELREIRVDAGPGQLLWSHPHSVDLILVAAGGRRPASVQAIFGEVITDAVGVVENDPIVLSATIWFEDGLAGHFGRAIGSALHLHCERGTVSVLANGSRTVVSELVGENPYPKPVSDQPFEMSPGNIGGSLAPISQLADCLAGDEDALATNVAGKRDIVTGQRILFALVQSARAQGVQTLLSDLDPSIEVRGRSGSLYA